MEFFEKYKTPILAAVVGGIMAALLSYVFQIPFWITGAIIGATVSYLTQTELANKIFDEQYAKLEKKRAESKAKKADEAVEEKSSTKKAADKKTDDA